MEYSASLFAAVVEITNTCNLRCPHSASDSGCAREDEMSLGELRGVVKDLAALGCKEFTMLGGEFLLRPDWYDVNEKDGVLHLPLADFARALRHYMPNSFHIGDDEGCET